MSESLFLINPRRKRRGMPAGLRRYWASRRKRRANPRKRARRRNPVPMLVNPRRRRRRVHVNHRRRRRIAHNPIRHRRRARHRNPIFRRRRARHRNPLSLRGVTANLKPAAIGAGGAIAAAILYGYISPQLPATLTTGFFPTIVKGAAAIGVGMLVSKFMGRSDGQYATMGGLTVVLVSAITPYITSAAPTLPGLSGLSNLGANDYIPYARPGMGAYMKRPGMGRLGFYSPAPVIQRGGMGAYMPRTVPGMGNLDLSGGSGFNGLNDGM
jgi:hypothetical protein